MKCYRKYGSDVQAVAVRVHQERPSMKCYRKNGSDREARRGHGNRCPPLNEVLPKER